MRLGFKSMSITLAFALIVSMVGSLTAFASSEKRVDIEGSENVKDSIGNYFTISNVIEEKIVDSNTIFTANAPVKVTFVGKGIGRQHVEYSTDGKLKDGDLTGDFEEVEFDVQKFVLVKYSEVENGETAYTPVDSLPADYDGEYMYQSGNYVTLTKPGYYYVWGSPMVMEGTGAIVHIAGESAPESIQPAGITVEPNASNVVVDGKVVAFEAYGIGGFNYFKLRDLAMAINGSTKNFEVTWDESKNAINLLSGKAYTAAGGELVVSANLVAKSAVPNPSKIYLDGKEVQLTAYTIDGSNYFKLRDIAEVLDFAVTWDDASSTIGIETSKPYSK